MKQTVSYDAAIDFSSNAAAFAVAPTRQTDILIDAVKPMNGRNSATLLPWLLDQLRAAGLSLAHIKRWTVGSGPGSFTGLRLAASLVEGIAMHNRQVSTRCLPSAFAMAAPFPAGSRIATIFDGRNRELLLFGVESRGDGQVVSHGQEMVLNRESAVTAIKSDTFDYLTALEKDRAAIAAILPEEIIAQIKFQPNISAANLLQLDSPEWPWDNDLTKLCYIRPAVFS